MKMNKVLYIFIFVFVIFLISTLGSKVLYGTWIITDYPKHISLFGRDYYQTKSNVIVLRGDKKPKYEVSTLINILTGKRIFVSEPKKGNYDPSSIYLQVGDDKYLTLVLSGGP